MLETKIGYVAVLPIGMAQVSSVIVTAEEGKELRKGGGDFAFSVWGVGYCGCVSGKQ